MKLNLLDDSPDTQPVAKDSLARLTSMAKHSLQIDREIEALEERISSLKEEQRRIEYEDLPNAMLEANCPEFNVIDGESVKTVKVTDIVQASLPSLSAIEKAKDEVKGLLEQRREQCLRWLRRNHQGSSIIKNELVVDIGKGNQKAVKEFMDLARTYKLAATNSETVHPQTLTKFIRELLKDEKTAPTVPLDTFAVFTGKQAKITKGK